MRKALDEYHEAVSTPRVPDGMIALRCHIQARAIPVHVTPYVCPLCERQIGMNLL